MQGDLNQHGAASSLHRILRMGALSRVAVLPLADTIDVSAIETLALDGEQLTIDGEPLTLVFGTRAIARTMVVRSSRRVMVEQG
jgi:hypothetical protein